MLHQSTSRPNQILGGDRELVLASLLIAVALAFALASWWGVGCAVAFWLGSVAVLQRMGKADPLMRQVYVRHVRYLPAYPAKAAVFSRCLTVPRNWR